MHPPLSIRLLRDGRRVLSCVCNPEHWHKRQGPREGACPDHTHGEVTGREGGRQTAGREPRFSPEKPLETRMTHGSEPATGPSEVGSKLTFEKKPHGAGLRASGQSRVLSPQQGLPSLPSPCRVSRRQVSPPCTVPSPLAAPSLPTGPLPDTAKLCTWSPGPQNCPAVPPTPALPTYHPLATKQPPPPSPGALRTSAEHKQLFKGTPRADSGLFPFWAETAFKTSSNTTATYLCTQGLCSGNHVF